MFTKRHILAAFVAATLSFTAVNAEARAQHYGQTVVKEAQRSISAAEAKSIALRHVSGSRYIDVKRRGNTYSVRVIIKKCNKVIDVLIDANSGRVKSKVRRCPA